MKLLTIGDSISQGFMSLAAAQTELSYPTLIARNLGLRPEVDYAVPTWQEGGLPLNIEKLLRKLQRRYGTNIRGPIEWPLALATIADMLDDVEDHYERGSGNIAKPQAGATEWYPNLSVRGFTVADAWKIDSAWCEEQILSDKDLSDDVLGLPNKSFARTAHAVLNPSRASAHKDKSQIAWLKELAAEEGVENLILALGSNNALGTVVSLKIKSTSSATTHPLQLPVSAAGGQECRDNYNLWTPDHFKAEFEQLLKLVMEAMENNIAPDWRVFVATVPAVSIAPLAKGVGNWTNSPDPFGVLANGAEYADMYTYVLFDENFARRTGRFLSRAQIIHIDETIAAFNNSIRTLVGDANTAMGVERFHIVDINTALLRAAFKRNSGNPTYLFPPALVALGKPIVNTAYYHVNRRGMLENGGLFSLDGVHPSAIGHGLLARDFLTTMQQAGVPDADPGKLDWTAIKASDTLFSNPIKLMPELYENNRLAGWLVDQFADI